MPELKKWLSLEWYGQTGVGWDIWGIFDQGKGRGETVCIQCVNRGRLTFAKAETDLSKVLKALNGTPQRFRFVTRSAVSAKMRGKIVFLRDIEIPWSARAILVVRFYLHPWHRKLLKTHYRQLWKYCGNQY